MPVVAVVDWIMAVVIMANVVAELVSSIAETPHANGNWSAQSESCQQPFFVNFAHLCWALCGKPEKKKARHFIDVLLTGTSVIIVVN